MSKAELEDAIFPFLGYQYANLECSLDTTPSKARSLARSLATSKTIVSCTPTQLVVIKQGNI